MSWLKKIFGGTKETVKAELEKTSSSLSSASLKIKQIDRLTEFAVKVIFDVPNELAEKYQFIPGQYLDVTLEINGEKERRSYSICSGTSEPLAIGVKQIENGIVSGHFNTVAKVGDVIEVAFPSGNFKLSEPNGNFVAIVGGSGITPVLSIAKSIDKSSDGKLHLLYGNRSDQDIMFDKELEDLSSDKIITTYIFSEQEKEGFDFGMLTTENITAYFRNNLDLLKADGFYLCGPEPVIINAQEALKTFGVSEDKLHYELFTTPVNLKSTVVEPEVSYTGISKVTVILDGESETFELATDGDTILEEAESYGMDAPYSCRGAVCCTCKGKVLEGSATMDKNFSLTDQEVKDGYILTCQAHPNSPVVVVSYDE